ncbi:MAG: alpha/beta fold hydrolase [Solirubrobacteraceae bacterium]
MCCDLEDGGGRVLSGCRAAVPAIGAGALAPHPANLPAAGLGWLFGPRLFSVSGLQDMATTIEAEDAFDLADLPAVRCPTLLVGGGRDRFYDQSLFVKTADLIPGCKLKLHPRRGHLTVLSDPRAVAQIRGFLSHNGSRP